MALTCVVRQNWISGDRRETITDVTFDSSYPTGGEAVTAGDLGFVTRVDHVQGNQATGGKSVAYDATNKKLLVFTGGTEATNASDQSGVTVRLRAAGN